MGRGRGNKTIPSSTRSSNVDAMAGGTVANTSDSQSTSFSNEFQTIQEIEGLLDSMTNSDSTSAIGPNAPQSQSAQPSSSTQPLASNSSPLAASGLSSDPLMSTTASNMPPRLDIQGSTSSSLRLSRFHLRTPPPNYQKRPFMQPKDLLQKNGRNICPWKHLMKLALS